MNSQWPVRDAGGTGDDSGRLNADGLTNARDTARLALAKPSLAAVLKTKRVFADFGWPKQKSLEV
jgi:hypothetical protein